MASLTVSQLLGSLEQDPENEETLEALAALAARASDEPLDGASVELLDQARQNHEARAEYAAVAQLLEVLAAVSRDEPERAAELFAELGRLEREELLDDERARAAFERALRLRPDDDMLQEAVEHLGQTADRWNDIATRFVEEAASASDPSLKSSLLVSAASLVWKYKKRGRDKQVDSLFRQALEVAEGDPRAVRLYERVLRRRQKWSELTKLLLDAAERASDREGKVGFLLRAARVAQRHGDDAEQALSCYERVLELAPGHPEATASVVEVLTAREQWDELIGLYETALRSRTRAEDEAGPLLQIAMIHWRLRGSPQDAEPHFARLRKLDPAHPGMLDFYREQLRGQDDSRWVAFLTDAQRTVSSDRQKLAIAIELAKVAQETSADRAIDAWKVVLRIDPTHPEAPAALRALYEKSEKWNALVELLKAEVDRTPQDQPARRVALLRQLVPIYREKLGLEAMAINCHTAILNLDPTDRQALDSLALAYESTGRWNDLIGVLGRKAEAAESNDEKVVLWMRVAELWTERFANFNQATDPLEKVLRVEPDNRVALGRLKDIYRKKRAYSNLFDVLSREAQLASDPTARLEHTLELARLAGERLHRHADAIALWKDVLAQSAEHAEALDALEKFAEREKDWETLAEVLEARDARADDPKNRLKILQKLGAIYGEHLAQPIRAASAWKRVLDVDPKNGRALRTLRETFLNAQDWDGLEALYADAADWEGLVDVLGNTAERASDPALKQALSFRAAEVFESKLNQPHRAFRSYERVLATDPANERAARALIPLYERDEKWNRLPALYEVLYGHAADDEARLELLDVLRRLAIERLSDSGAAFGYAARAFALAPQRADVLSALRQETERSGRFAAALDLYLARLDALTAAGLGADEALSLRRMIAELASGQLDRADLAVAQLREVLAERPADDAAAEQLETLFRSQARARELHELLLHRLQHAADDAERKRHLVSLARLEEEVLEDAEAAAGRYRQVLEFDGSDLASLSALERLGVSAGRWAEVADVLARRRAQAGNEAERRELTLRLGEVMTTALGDHRGALDAFMDVLSSEPDNSRAIAGLELLSASAPELGVEVAQALESAYQAVGAWDKLAELAKQGVESAGDAAERRAQRLRLAELSGRTGDAVTAYEALEEQFLEDPADSEVQELLVRAAEAADRDEALAAAFAKALASTTLREEEAAALAAKVANLYDSVLARPSEAEPFHLRVLAHDPLDERAFRALKDLYTEGERWPQLQALYRERIAQTFDAEAKLELLLQTCFLFEEVLGDSAQAIRAYQEVLELDPEHAASRRALEGLYESTGSWRELAELLREELDRANPDEQIGLTQRLGVLHEKRLGDAAAAVDHYERVLEAEPHHRHAREALERLLADAGQRQRIALILEPIYLERDDWRELVGVLRVQLEGVADSGSQVSLLMRIADLSENRLHDVAAAFSSVARAVVADPSDAEVRAELARLAQLRNGERDRAAVLEQAVGASEDAPSVKAEILLELARLWDERVGDAEHAAAAYGRLADVDADDAEMVLLAARALERIHLAQGDHAALVADLRKQARLEPDVEDKGRLLVRLGQLLEDVLEDRDGAISVHQERLELDPSDLDAMEALERLYEQAGQWPQLIGTLQARDAEVADAERQCAIGLRIAEIYEHRLEDRESAIVAYNDVLARFGRDPQALDALARLYEQAERWADLLEVVEMVFEEARVDARAAHRFRMAEIMRTRTGELERAVEVLAEVLELAPDHAGALGALGALVGARASSEDGEGDASIVASPSPEVRIQAARVLAPYREASGDYPALLEALSVLAESDDPAERFISLCRAAQVADSALDDPARAFELQARAVKAGVAEDGLADLLDDLARLAQASGCFEAYVAHLEEIVPEILDAELAVVALTQIAEVAREQLGDHVLARRSYERVLEHQPDSIAALDALIGITTASGDQTALLDALRRKTEVIDDAGERVRLYVRRAALQEAHGGDDGGDLVAAIDCYEQALAEGRPREAYEGLERLYTKTERFSDLATHCERMIEDGVGDPVALHHRIGLTQLERLDDAWAAIEHFRRALELNPRHEATLGVLERLMQEEAHRAAAAEILEPIFQSQLRWPQVTACVEARIASETDVDARKKLIERLGQIHEDYLEDLDGALEVYARLFREDIRDEGTWDTLSRLARALSRHERLAVIYQAALDESGVDDEVTAKLAVIAAQLHETRGGSLEAAASLYAAALRYAPDDQDAFVSLERVLLQRQAWEPLLELYLEQAGVTVVDEDRVALTRKSARLLREQLGRPDRAIEQYRDILVTAPDDADAIAALDALFVSGERWADLAEHLRHQLELGPRGPAEATLKARLARLLSEKLGDLTAALDLYEEITQSDPRNAEALQALEGLVQLPDQQLRIIQILEPVYLAQDQWRKLIAIYEAQTGLVDDAYERTRLLGQIAELHESRGGDMKLALHAWSRAMLEEPENDEPRGQVDRLVTALGAWDALVQTYEAAFAATTDPATRAALLSTLAQVHDERRGDPRAAIATYERLAAEDPNDLGPLDSLEALHSAVEDWEGFVDVVQRKVQRSFDAGERAQLLRRAGSVLADLIGDRARAIEAYRAALVEDESDDISLESLDEIYSESGEKEPLVEVLARRIELDEDPSNRVSLGLRLGAAQQELARLSDAIDTYQRVLDDEPEQPEAVEALSSLFEREQRWSELLDNLRLRAASAPSDTDRLALLERTADLLEKELDDVPAAIATHEEILGLQPKREGSIQALLRIGRLESHREAASEVVEPLLRAFERWDDLAGLIELRVQADSDPERRREDLRRLAELHEQGRGDTEAAMAAYERALAEDASDTSLADELERLAPVLDAWGRAADAFTARASTALDPEVGRDLYARVARIAEEHLGDAPRAIEAHVRTLELISDDASALAALDRLYTKAGAWAELSEVLDRRVHASHDAAERADLLVRLGTVKQERFADHRGAFRAFAEVLETNPSDERAVAAMELLLDDAELASEVIEVLDAVYRQTGAVESAAGLFDVRIELAGSDGERVRLLQEQAQVFEQELGDAGRALGALRRAFELDPRDEALLEDLERLAPVADAWESLRGLVEGALDGRGVDRSIARDLNLRAARWYRDFIGDPAAAEARLRAAIAAEPDISDAHDQLIELLRIPGREKELVLALVNAADVEYDLDGKRARLHEAARLAQFATDDRATATACYQKILAADPQDAEALDQLIALEADQPPRVAELLAQRIDVESDAELRVALRKRLGRLHAEALGNVAAAIDAWQGALGEEPTDLECIAALEGLYEKSERFEELEDLIQRRLDIAETPAERIAARVRLARLADQRLGRREDAIAQLREILEEDRRNQEALDELERLLAADQRWQELLELLEQRAGDSAGTAEELDALVRLGTLHVDPLRDLEGAIAMYERVLSREPDHLGVLEALARLHRERQDWAAAADVLERLGALQGNNEARDTAFAVAELAATHLGDAARAERALRRAFELDPTSSKARTALKAHYEQHGQHGRLVELLALDEQEVSEAKPKAALLKRIASIYASQLSNPGAAATYLERASALEPDDRATLLALCDLYIAAGRQDDAVPVLEQIVASYGGRRSKEVAVYHHRLGKAKQSRGDLDGALESYDAAFKVDLTNVDVLADLGRLCVARGDLDRAQKTFRALLLQKLSPGDSITKADVYFYLAGISARQDDPKKAISMLERALAEDAGHAQASALLAKLKG